MSTEKKVTQRKKKVVDTSKEVITTEKKQPCETCKEPKEIEVKLPNYTREEMEQAMILIDRFRTTGQENEWLVNLNNRVNNDRKLSAGCGKCMVQVKKNLANAYRRLYS